MGVSRHFALTLSLQFSNTCFEGGRKRERKGEGIGKQAPGGGGGKEVRSEGLGRGVF